jgi:hypothetical protein
MRHESVTLLALEEAVAVDNDDKWNTCPLCKVGGLKKASEVAHMHGVKTARCYDATAWHPRAIARCCFN